MEELTLKIEFVGLCLFATQDDQITVLMPAPENLSCHDDDHHNSTITYQIFDEATQKVRTLSPPMENLELDLSSFGEDAFTKPSLSEIANIYSVTNEKVPRRLIDDPDPEYVRTRIRINRGTGTPHRAVGRWEILGHVSTSPMTHRTTWTMKNIDDPYLRLIGLRGNPDPQPIKLHPTHGVIKLKICHTPNVEPQTPRTDARSEHFAHYYTLFPEYRENPNRPVPRYRGLMKDLPHKRRDGHLLTCMHARAPVA